jgi:hypothetical protein
MTLSRVWELEEQLVAAACLTPIDIVKFAAAFGTDFYANP